MTTFTALLISILIRMGIIGSEADYQKQDAKQQEQWKKEIIIDDTIML